MTLVPTSSTATLVPTLSAATLVPTLSAATLVPTLSAATLVPTPLYVAFYSTAVTYGSGLFVAVATGADHVLSSTNGIDWTSSTFQQSTNVYSDVTHGNEVFVAVGLNCLMMSGNGITWKIQNGEDYTWSCVTYGNNRFVAVGSYSMYNTFTNDFTYGNLVITSLDGTNWSKNAAPGYAEGGLFFSAVTYANGRFVAVGEARARTWTTLRESIMWSSDDGKSWVLAEVDSVIAWTGITYGKELFVAVGQGAVMTSPNGIAWTVSDGQESQNHYRDVTYGNGLFVAVTGNRVMTSPDGTTWTHFTPAADHSYTAVTYGNGLFVAVRDDCNGGCSVTVEPDQR